MSGVAAHWACSQVATVWADWRSFPLIVCVFSAEAKHLARKLGGLKLIVSAIQNHLKSSTVTIWAAFALGTSAVNCGYNKLASHAV